MKAKKLHLENFRGATNLEICFHERLNVLYGENGAGKSTVLDAIAIMLSWFVNRLGRIQSNGSKIKENDITNKQAHSNIEFICSNHDRDVFWKLAATRKGNISNPQKAMYSELNTYVEGFQKQITEKEEKVNLPLLAYYPIARAVQDIPLRIRRNHKFNLSGAYDEALKGGANFRTFFEWFREREDLENEMRNPFNIKNGEYLSKSRDTQLEAVRKALAELMPDFKKITVRRSPLRMEVTKNGKTLRVEQLSDGEKCLMAMVGDLARRMAIANPDREDPLAGDGIILIDEIDLHLHPGWQRKIVPGLLKVFPNCQFVISTHSPHVITHVKPESLFQLKQSDDGMIIERPSESYGKTVDRILEDLMGLKTTRPDNVSKELTSIADLIDKNKLLKAKKLISQLKEEIGNDPELTKDSVYIKRKELIGK